MEKRGLMKNILIEVEKITYECSDFVLPNSIGIKTFILENIFNHPKVKTLGYGSSNGIDLSFFDPNLVTSQSIKTLRTNYNIHKKDIVISFVGRICNSKGINELVKAFLLLKNKHVNLKLLLVGSFDNTYPIEASVDREIHQNQDIIATENQEDIRPFLSISEVFVFPSYREGMPQALMQAIAMKIPCIATDINGCNEIIEDGVSGYLVPVKNIEAIVERTDVLLSNPDFKKTIIEKAHSDLCSKFEQKKVWKKIQSFYKENLRKS
jgi:glycosyltransferase involved in cell wall biosynthesis